MQSYKKSRRTQKAVTAVMQQAKNIKARYDTPSSQSPNKERAVQQIREMIEPFIPDIEDFRQDMLAEHKKRQAMGMQIGLFVLGGIFCILLLTAQSLCGSGPGASCMFEIAVVSLLLTVIVMVFVAFWMNAPLRDYVNGFKRDILPIVVSAYDPSFHYVYEEKKGFTDLIAAKRMWNGYKDYPEAKLLSKSGFFDLYKVLPGYVRDDCIKGQYKNVRFTFVEAVIGQGRYESQALFSGGIFIIKFDQSFSGHTLLMDNSAKFKKMFTPGKSRATGDRYERVVMEDSVFERKFEVYGTDQQEARYILSPALMERLQRISLGRYDRDKAVQAAFFENYAIIFVSYRDNLFEPADIKNPVTDIESVILILEEFEKVCSVIDDMNMTVFAKRRAGAARMDEVITDLDNTPAQPAYTSQPRKSTAPTTKSPFT